MNLILYGEQPQLQRRAKPSSVLLFFFFFFSFFAGYSQVYQWAKKMGGANDEFGGSVTTDNLGNVYTTGYFSGTNVDFDPGPSTFTLSSAGNRDVFITKFDANGNFIWAKRAGSSTGTDQGSWIVADPAGNIYIAGVFGGTADFDPGPGTYNLSSLSGGACFVMKLDPAGNFAWARVLTGASGNAYGSHICMDRTGNLYTTGWFIGTIDFDPGAGVATQAAHNNSLGYRDVFICKMDANGNYIWAKIMGGNAQDYAYGADIGSDGSIYTIGTFQGTADFDPSADTLLLISTGGDDAYITKLDSMGNLIWARQTGTGLYDYGSCVTVNDSDEVYISGDFNMAKVQKLDRNGNFLWSKNFDTGVTPYSYMYAYGVGLDPRNNICLVGLFKGTVDFDPGPAIHNVYAPSIDASFILNLDADGDFISTAALSTITYVRAFYMHMDNVGNVYLTGEFAGTTDFDPSAAVVNLTSVGGRDVFVAKYKPAGVYGVVYNDANANCTKEPDEIGLANRTAVIDPGNIVVETGVGGEWYASPLPAGTYTITYDTSGYWAPTCSSTATFSVPASASVVLADSIGMKSTLPCAMPDVYVSTSLLRRCFTNNAVYIRACNLPLATDSLYNGYVILQLDTSFIPLGSSMAYTDLGDHRYRFDVGTLAPAECVNIAMTVKVSCNVVLGQTLCAEADLYPSAPCSQDTTPDYPADFAPCLSPWDTSHLEVDGWCQNDSIYFTVSNTAPAGTGDMNCYTPVRLFIDGHYMWLDSLRLNGGETDTMVFAGDGRTWRLEADQHPLHPGNSRPSATLELCGNPANWTPGLVSALPFDDLDPEKATACTQITASLDPNDKTGIPLGITETHFIAPNGQIDYVIRFQNTGNDTAFTVVVRDTLDQDLDILSVRPGASSHDYYFRMYGPRILEWTFNNILLPDSTTNETGSHGYLSFSVNQEENLPDNTEINNTADIYFDYNAPVITNTTDHIIHRDILHPSWTVQQNIIAYDCSEYNYNGISYIQSGTYVQVKDGLNGADTLVTLNVTIGNKASAIVVTACDSYTAPDNVVYTTSGIKTAVIPSVEGCDSIITINLTINPASAAALIENVCGNYTAPDGVIYSTSGIKTAIIPNSLGCDSTIVIDLTVNQPTFSSITEIACNSYTAPDGSVYTSSGIETVVISNAEGCDSTITINLTVNQSSGSSITEYACDQYTSPDGAIYTTSGIKTAVLPNAAGCDSTISIDLTIYHSSDIDTSLTLNENLLESNTAGAVYQWIDCINDQPIPGETNQSYIASANGEYAVIISLNGCTDTSSCANVLSVGLKTEGRDLSVRAIPNPTTGWVMIEWGEREAVVEIAIINTLGQSVIQKKVSGPEKQEIFIEGDPGIYFIRIISGSQTEIVKVVKL
jgi:uncharacterized repeat protein (TIGR01451 family)